MASPILAARRVARFLLIAVLLYADRDAAPIFGRYGDVIGR